MAQTVDKPPPSPLWIGAALLVVGALTSLGFVRGGANLGLLYGLGGLVVGVSLVSIERAVRVHKALNRAQPKAPETLGPNQTLSILAASADRGQGKAPSFASPVLAAVEQLDAAAQRDPSAALIEAEELATKWPNSPAIVSKRAEIELATGRIEQAAKTAAAAIELALNQGSAPRAVELARRFGEHVDQVGLAPDVRERLVVVLRARELGELARTYSEASSPPVDEGPVDEGPVDEDPVEPADADASS